MEDLIGLIFVGCIVAYFAVCVVAGRELASERMPGCRSACGNGKHFVSHSNLIASCPNARPSDF